MLAEDDSQLADANLRRTPACAVAVADAHRAVQVTLAALALALASGETLAAGKVIFATGRVGNTEGSGSRKRGWRPTTEVGSSSITGSAPPRKASTRRAM